MFTKELHIFDLDHTLIMPDEEVNKRTCYFGLHGFEYINPMMNYFNSINNGNKVILTTRHPAIQAEIEHIFSCPVYCRDFCNDWKEIELAGIYDTNFLDDMVRWKTRVLNDFAQHYDSVTFYDDMVERYDESLIANNVKLINPLNMEFLNVQ